MEDLFTTQHFFTNLIAVQFIWTITTLRLAIAELGWMDAVCVIALELAWHALKFGAVLVFIWAITTVILQNEVNTDPQSN
jgi:hypothetical protein